MWMRWPYPGWSESRKRALRRAVDQILDHDAYSALGDPPVNRLRYPDNGNVSSMVLQKPDAWGLYLTHVAHSLAMEIKGEFGWSLKDLSAENQRQLLASTAFFQYRFGHRGYAIESAPHGVALPAPPKVMFKFMRSHGIIQGTRRETIFKLLEWSRDNLSHFSGKYEAANLEAHWHYRGFPPVSRILSGTHTPSGFEHAIAGCHGHYGFLKAMLRTANIPVLCHRVGLHPHALPWFPSEGLYMSHGDDPYARDLKSMIDPLPIERILINQTRWNHWFGPHKNEGERGRNIGRQLRELSRHHLSWYLVSMHCQDLADGKSHTESSVYHDYFVRTFPVAQLEADGVWDRLDAKLLEIGGCAYLAMHYS